MKKDTYNNILESMNDQQKKSIPSFQQFKQLVKHEHATKYKQMGYKLSHVYNEMSKLYGFNWHTLSVFLKENDSRNGICSTCDNKKTVGKNKRPCPDCQKSMKKEKKGDEKVQPASHPEH